jgi:hypothetical protein
MVLPMRKALATLTPDCFARPGVAGEAVEQVLTRTPGDDGPIGGIKIVTGSGWSAVGPPVPRTSTRSIARTSGAPRISTGPREARAFATDATTQAGDRR